MFIMIAESTILNRQTKVAVETSLPLWVGGPVTLRVPIQNVPIQNAKIGYRFKMYPFKMRKSGTDSKCENRVPIQNVRPVPRI